MSVGVVLAAPDRADRRPGALAGWYGLAVVILASVVGSVVGKGLISLVAESMRISLKLTDAQLGLLNGLALTAVTALAAVPVGWLTDKVDRRVLLAACVLIWSAASIGFGLSTDFPVLFAFACGIAVGEAVLGPMTYSLIPDLFPREKWVVANSVVIVGMLLGTNVAYLFAGQLLGFVTANPERVPALISGGEPWRTAMIAVAWTGPVLALLILLMRLKRRAPAASAADAPPATEVGGYFRAHGRSLAGVFVGFGLSYAAYGAQSTFGAVVLQRLFGEHPADIGRVLGTVGAIASLSGVAAGALLARWFRRKLGDQAPLTVAQGALFASFLVTCTLPFLTSATQYYAVVAVKIACVFTANSLAPTILQLLAPPHLRGRVIAIGGMIMLASASAMPWVIGEVSDHMHAGPRGILYAIAAVVLPATLVAVLVLRWGSKTIPATMRAANP